MKSVNSMVVAVTVDNIVAAIRLIIYLFLGEDKGFFSVIIRSMCKEISITVEKLFVKNIIQVNEFITTLIAFN